MVNFESGKFHLVITDINMPRISGVELMHWISEREPEIQIIILTGYGTYPLMHEALRNGVSDFLDKPFDFELLDASVRKALDDRRKVTEEEFALVRMHPEKGEEILKPIGRL